MKDKAMILNSGCLKGLKLKVAKGGQTRPTSAKTRESFVNMIQGDIAESYFVDLFAGSGAVGLAVLSRGAGGCLFVENDRESFKALSANLKEARTRITHQSLKVGPLEALQRDAYKAWAEISSYGQPDIIWADPPYSMAIDWLNSTEAEVFATLKSGGLFALEMSASDRASISLDDNKWLLVKERKFSDTLICIWKKKECADD